MSTHLKILTQHDIAVFEFPPQFNGEERKRFFTLPKGVLELVENMQTPINKVGFILQFGYFKDVNRFFVVRKFHKQDVEFVARRFSFVPEEIDLENYAKTTAGRHREIILEHFGFQPFEEQAKLILVEESLSFCTKCPNQIKPRFMFTSLVDFLKTKRIEIPGYYTLSEIITEAFRRFEKNLLSLLGQHLTAQEKNLLDELLEISAEYLVPEKQNLQIKQYKVTTLKKSYQSVKPMQVKENIRDFEYLHTLFEKLDPIIKRLNLSSEIIRYYASIAHKSQVFQISRREDNKYLLLIAFVIHRYYTLNDVLTEILIQAVQTSKNTVLREYKEKFYEVRHANHQTFNNLSRSLQEHLSIWQEIELILYNQELTDESKVKVVKNLLLPQKTAEYPQIKKQLVLLEKETGRNLNDNDFYDILETRSVKLQNRVSEIVKHLVFDKETSNGKIIATVEYYQRKNGDIGADAPLDFLELTKQQRVINKNGKFRISLCKALVFQEIAEAIKSGALNLRYSYKYRSFDDYLIPQSVWAEKKIELCSRAGLTEFADFQKVESGLKQAAQSQYQITNENINTGENKFAKIRPEGTLKVWTPKTEDPDMTDTVGNLFPQNRFIPLFEVLTTVNKFINFLDAFTHWQIKYNRAKPPEKTFLAGIIGCGCNLGIRKIAKISNNINQNELENTVNWYFSEDNLAGANNKILDFINQLQLSRIFQKTENIIHTSSDGQKFNIGVDSLNANYSYKYFGKGRGVSVYSFIDEKHRLFYSTVISSSEREASYVVDGLMHNEVVQSNFHSTDTHGYSEMIFGVTHLLGISYAPRIKNFRDQRLYNFDNSSGLKDRGYKILPDGKINSNIIAENWDNILHLVVTIKLKEAAASQLFQRLSSYSQQHPTYRAIKEFGKIIKTIFLLKYIDDVELRQDVEKQLNKLENSNKFAKAVFYGNNQEFQQATKEEQLIAEGCKRLIQNAIICWNYLYLSQLLCHVETPDEKYNLIQTIKNSSVVAWQHINLQGEYDFSEEILKNSIEFNAPELLQLSIPILPPGKID